MTLLIAHPAHPPATIASVQAAILGLERHWLRLRWRVEGARDLVVPPFAGKRRTDGLWQTTCFELFVRAPQGEGYCEFNLSPSERWAAYDFTAYREGMSERPIGRDPVCTIRRGADLVLFDAAIPRAGLHELPWAVGLSAVLEEAGGVKSFWALAHPAGKPDFHDPACFAATVPAPAAA